jgi:hypothetical protein
VIVRAGGSRPALLHHWCGPGARSRPGNSPRWAAGCARSFASNPGLPRPSGGWRLGGQFQHVTRHDRLRGHR